MGSSTSTPTSPKFKNAAAAAAAPPTPTPAEAAPEAAPEAAAGMRDYLPYARAVVKLDQVLSELRDSKEKAIALDIELSCPSLRAVADPVRAEALKLLGEGDGGDGGAADYAAKTARLQKLRSRITVLQVAADEGRKIVRKHDSAAARAVVAAAMPEYRRRLVPHAQTVVTAARSVSTVQELIDIVAEEVGSCSGGLSHHIFQGLGDISDPYSAVGLFIRELVENDILSGDEPWLAGVCFHAQRPDGSTVSYSPPTPPTEADRAAADLERHRAARSAIRGVRLAEPAATH